jgi:uncharacterized membrane-anchored protein
MKARLLIATLVIALQVAVLGFMAVQREWVLRHGRPLLLRTAPIDPSDPMRGDYTRFNYDLTTVARSQWSSRLKVKFATDRDEYNRWRDLQVFASVKLDDLGVAELVTLSDEPPASGPFLRGRVDSYDAQRITVRYGIEAMFMQQGKSQQLEEARWKERPGTPIDVEVAVNDVGLAVLKNYRWEPLGFTATFERSPLPAPPNAPANPPRPRQFISAIKLELKNYGPEDVAIVDSPAGGALRLVPDWRGMEPRYRWSGEGRATAKPTAEQIIVLKPGQSHTMRIELTRPEWFVIDLQAPQGKRTPTALRDVTDAWAAAFRVEYAPPSKADTAGLPHAELIRHSRLLSRGFNAGMSMD